MRSTFLSTAGIRSRVQPSAYAAISSSIRAECAVTPRTSSTAYADTGGLPIATRSASRSSTGSPRNSASKRTSSARLRALLRAGGITASQRAPAPTGLTSEERARREGGASKGARRRVGPAERAGPAQPSGAAEVLAGPGVDLDLLPGRDEQRNLDRRAGLEQIGRASCR